MFYIASGIWQYFAPGPELFLRNKKRTEEYKVDREGDQEGDKKQHRKN